MRSIGAACVLVVVSCSPFGESGTYMCGSDSDCNAGDLGVCSGTPQQPGTCTYGGSSPKSDAGGVVIDVGMIDPPQSDAPRGSGSAQTCWGTTLMVCPPTIPTNSHTLTGNFNTNNDCDFTWPQTNGPTLCVISATNWTLGEVEVVGSAPLVVFATDTITIVGSVDASSVPNSPGPDANDANDPNDPVPCAVVAASLAGDGGAGGSFGLAGGAGAGGGTGGSAGGSPSTGAITPVTIRGGCVGQASRTSTGGDGGGAIYLLAGREIDIDGPLLANGEGGSGGKSGGQSSGGGAGGGAGGFIGLEAPTINVTNLLLADGIVLALAGGGGGGGGDFSGGGPPGFGGGQNTDGGAGANGDAYIVKATKGTIPGGTAGSSKAGAGGAATTAGGNGGGGATDGTAGGGGGAGGAGVIWTTGHVNGSSLILPTPTQK